MASDDTFLTGPDLAQGVASSALADGAMLLGHAHGESLILVRQGGQLFAVGAVCTHWNGPLADGLLVGDTVRCPWHHAAFSLRTGEAVRAPALKPITCRQVEEIDGRVCVRQSAPTLPRKAAPPEVLQPIVIVGGGAAGQAAAEALRRAGHEGSITLFSADPDLPCDRPNLSKYYLDGSASDDWVPLRPASFYEEQRIDLRLGTRVAAIDTARREVQLEDGSRHGFDALLLATGAEPVRLPLPGADLPHARYLRSWADARALAAAAGTARQAVVIGASFIGLEVAASLRKRGLRVHVVGRETALMERVLGTDVGAFLRRLHEQHGVVFHLGVTPETIDARGVLLSNGETLAADLVVIGVGVRPALALAEQAGLALDRGVTVDEYLQTSVPGIYAAGDIARWPDPHSSAPIRVEHWVVAQRLGQVAAHNMLGQRERFQMVPFFWTEQFDFGLAYVGHAEGFDQVVIDGDIDARDCRISYRRAGQELAAAFVHRDLEGLRTERAFENALAAAAPAPTTTRSTA